MWWCRKKYADPTNTQKSIRNILRMEWGCIIKIHVQNPFDNLLALELLLPIFAYSNAILKFELPKKTSLPYCQPSLLYIWRERDHVWDLFHNQRKIEKCYITKFEHLNLKLEKQKHNKKEHFWRKMKKKCFIYKHNTWCQRIALCNHLPNWESRNVGLGNFLASLKTTNSFHILNQDNFYSVKTLLYQHLWLQIHVIMNLYLIQEICTHRRITY